MHKSILFIIPSLNYGGAELLVVQQVQWLYRNNWSIYVAILSNHYQTALVEALGIPKQNILFIGSSYATLNFRSVVFAFRNQHILKQFVVAHNIKTIVAHLPIAHLWGRLVKLKVKAVRLLIYHHSMQYQANPLNSLGKKGFNLFQKYLAGKADDTTICISEAVKKNIQSHFLLRNPVILYNAVIDNWINAFSSPVQERLFPDKNKISLIIPGRLHAAKGHLFFLPVFDRLLKSSGKDLQLTIAGGGTLETAIKDFIISKKLAQNVVVTGFISNKSLLQKIAQADFVIIPSISEGLGIVAIEALMSGRTILASDAGGLKEIIRDGDNGYLFKAEDYTDCLDKLTTIIETYPDSLMDPDKLRKDYKARFGFEAHMAQLMSLL